MKSEPAHLCADSNKSAGHSVHEVVLLGKERHNPAVDRLAGELSWWEGREGQPRAG